MLYGKKGSWEALQAEIARSRAVQKAELLKIAKKEQMFKDIGFAVVIVLAISFVLGIFGFIAYQASAKPPPIYYRPLGLMYF